jgi:hypothetical protein
MSGPSVARGLRVCGRACLTLLAALLPFEMTRPLARLGPLQISSVELFLYLTLAVWASSLAAEWLWEERDLRLWLRRAPPTHGPVLAWALAIFLSAACALALRGTAAKFALRSLSGILLYGAAADLLRDPHAARRVVKALVAGALLASLGMIAEGHLASVTGWLRLFHAQTFEVFGLVRGSGPFQYPNIAAMYLEAVLPLAFVLGLPSRAGPAPDATQGALGLRRSRLAGAALMVGALMAGILVTASRGGLGTAVVCLCGIGVFLARSRQTRRAAVAAFAALAGLVLASQLSSSALTLRLRFWKDADWYRAAVEPVASPAGRMPPSIVAAGVADVAFQVRNLGALTWRQLPPREVALSYHWIDAGNGTLVVFDGARSPLPRDVPPGGEVIVPARVRAPAGPGRYVLWWDLVQERATWFSERGNPGWRSVVEVQAKPRTTGRAAPVVPVAPPQLGGRGFSLVSGDVIPRRALWGAAVAAWREHPLLGLGPDNFRHLYGRYLKLADPDDRLHANSLYFETLANLGTVGLLALAFLIASFGRAIGRAAAAPATRILALGLGAGLCAYLLHGVFDYFLEFTPTYGLLWLLGGMTVALGRPPAERGA